MIYMQQSRWQIAVSPDSPVGIYVMSPHHFTFGMSASKSRPTRCSTPHGRQPLGRANEPDAVAHVIAYLTGEQARPITGTVLAVDAGRVSTR